MATKAKRPVATPSAPKKYPYNTLRQCMKLSAIVKEHGGDSASVPKSVIAQEMGTDQGSSMLSQLVASAKTYGIVDGLQELCLTELGREYYFPLSDDGKRSAELAFLAQPPAFEYLIKRFDGSRLPSPNILANELGRNCGVSESWRNRAASFFINTAQDLGVVDAGNFLRYAAAKHSADSTAPHTSTDAADSGPITVAPETAHLHATKFSPDVRVGAPVDSSKTTAWTHGAIRVETPNPLTRQLWEKLQKYVELMEPDEQAKEG
jgi:hypothetical protein